MEFNIFDEENTDKQLRESFCLFLDLLGFTEQIKSYSDNLKKAQAHFDSIYKAFEKATQEIRYDSEFHRKSNNYFINWNCKMFSDNIVIGCPLDVSTHSEGLLWRLIENVGKCQLDLVISGYFLRGGCTVGPLYMNDIMVYGSGLLDAYEMEQKANYPAIMLTRKAEEYVMYHTKLYGEIRESAHYNTIYISENGSMFVNYLHYLIYSEDPYELQIDNLLLHKKLILDNIDVHKANPKIQLKYRWVADYHNYFCRQLPRDYGIDIPSGVIIHINSGFEFTRINL